MRLRSVQALRAFAALAVLMCHLYAIEGNHAQGPLLMTEVWVNGASGVDFFFVISGFIMVWVAGDTTQSITGASRFLFARATRIYPLWWLFAGLMAMYFLVTYGVPWDEARVAETGANGFWHLLKSALLIPQSVHPVLGVGWTLIHEMYFYVAFALLVLLCPVRYRLAAILAWAVLVIAGALLTRPVGHASTLLELAVFPMTLEFVGGALVAYLIKAGVRAFALPILILGVVSYVAIFIDFSFIHGQGLLARLDRSLPHTFALGWGRTLLFGLPVAAILYGLVALELKHGLKRAIPDFAVHLGDWSYALYLSHILVISAVGRLYFPVFGGEGLIDNGVFLVIAAGAAILCSGLTYYLFEKPLITRFASWRAGLFPAKPARA
ncbi:MAG: acyltransferase [Henriciella sp.]|nr:acyltransferase [Henriciella sp.]